MRIAWTAALLLALATSGVPAGAAPPLTRAQALSALQSPDAGTRVAAALRLGEVGAAADDQRLLPRLHDQDDDVREAAEAALWRIWSRSGDAAIDRLYERGVRQMQQADLDAALGTFGEIVRRRPAFAEGWNKRATIHFLKGRYAESIKDCDEVLRRNPNHFGALAGYARMLAQLGRTGEALDALQHALRINPNLPGGEEAVELLQRQLDERRRNSI